MDLQATSLEIVILDLELWLVGTSQPTLREDQPVLDVAVCMPHEIFYRQNTQSGVASRFPSCIPRH